MELALNLVWVCVAVAALLALGASLSNNGAQLRRPASYGRKVIAMSCALVILFFIISMTDDLHGQEILIEEKRTSRMALIAGAGAPGPSASTRSIPLDILLFFPPHAFSAPLPSMGRLLEPSRFLFPPASDQEGLCDRAPPLSL
jgi:hypothetical protein